MRVVLPEWRCCGVRCSGAVTSGMYRRDSDDSNANDSGSTAAIGRGTPSTRNIRPSTAGSAASCCRQ